MKLYNSMPQLAASHRTLARLLSQRRTTSCTNCPTGALESCTKQTTARKDAAFNDLRE
jgi:hypothetical protein